MLLLAVRCQGHLKTMLVGAIGAVLTLLALLCSTSEYMANTSCSYNRHWQLFGVESYAFCRHTFDVAIILCTFYCRCMQCNYRIVHLFICLYCRYRSPTLPYLALRCCLLPYKQNFYLQRENHQSPFLPFSRATDYSKNFAASSFRPCNRHRCVQSVCER